MDALKDERFDFTILENKVIRDTDKFGKNELLAYVALSSFANKAGTCFPSYDEIARIMRTSRRTAIEGVNGLVEKGIVKVENRKNNEKKKEATSNLYTLVSCDLWGTAVSENRKFMLNRKVKYNKIVAKSKATKIANELEKKDKKNKPECESDLSTTNITTHNECFVDNSISLNAHKKQQKYSDSFNQKNTNFDNENMKLVMSANLKNMQYEKHAELIAGLDTEILKEALRATLEGANIPNWNYCIKTYRDFESAKNRQSQNSNVHPYYMGNNRQQVKTRFHNIKQTFTKYSPDELEKILQESQKGKFGDDNYKKTGFHNFEETFTQYSENELDDIIANGQKEKYGQSFVPTVQF